MAYQIRARSKDVFFECPLKRAFMMDEVRHSIRAPHIRDYCHMIFEYRYVTCTPGGRIMRIQR